MNTPSPMRSSLEQSLEQLHAELARTPRVEPGAATLLRDVLRDIERLLQPEPASEPAPGEAGAPHRLEALAVHFEADHPALAASLRQFIDLLGRAGL